MGYLISNLVMWPAYHLPGVFQGNHYAAAVNGSLWTLMDEVHAYIIVAMLGVAGLMARRWLMMAVWSLVVVLAVVAPYGSQVLGDVILLEAFAVGAALYAWRRRCGGRAGSRARSSACGP